jgi:hypothetical protein
VSFVELVSLAGRYAVISEWTAPALFYCLS